MGKYSCYQSVKDRKFESNSQLAWGRGSARTGCYQSVKDRKFESNSQLQIYGNILGNAVISLSKIENLKAIHNKFSSLKMGKYAVISLSKIENLKAIHNIRNAERLALRSCYQSVKDRKFESNSQL